MINPSTLNPSIDTSIISIIPSIIGLKIKSEYNTRISIILGYRIIQKIQLCGREKRTSNLPQAGRSAERWRNRFGGALSGSAAMDEVAEIRSGRAPSRSAAMDEVDPGSQ